MEIVVLVLLGLAIVFGVPILAIAAIIVAMGARTRIVALEQETKALRDQLAFLTRGGMIPATAVTEPQATPLPGDTEPATGEAPASAAEPLPPPTDIGALAEATGPSDGMPPPLPVAALTAGSEASEAPLPPPFTPPPAPSRPTGPSLEESIGTRWTVWIGGLALAFGGVFLVKYSIDEGLFTPLMRVVLGCLLSAVLIGLGEFLRRRETGDGGADGLDAPRQAAPIPSILTAAGTIALFATIYAAYALYHLIGDGAAFVLLGLTGIGAMLAALLHGPWIATLGIFGAYATPLMIETTTPNMAALIAYLLAVTLAAFGVARLRLWHLVAFWALGLALAWGFAIDLALPRPGDAATLAAYIGCLIILVVGFFVVGLDEALDPPFDRSPNLPGLAGVTGLAVLTLLLLQADRYDAAGLTVAVILVIAALGLGWRYPAMALAPPIASLFALVALAGWMITSPATLDTGVMVQDFDGIVRIRPNLIGEFATVAALAAALFIGAGGLGALRATPSADRTGGWFAGVAAIAPVLGLIIAWLRIDGWAPSPLFAGLALALAAILATLTTRLIAREDAAQPSLAVAVAAIGTIAALGAGFTIALEKGALTIALVLMVAAIASVNAVRPIAVLRPIAALIGAIVLARILYDPRIVGDALGTTPVFNWLLYGYGVPTLAFAYAARSFRRQLGAAAATDVSIGALEALAILFAGLLGVFELHHAMNDGAMVIEQFGADELGLQVTLGIIGMLALAQLTKRVRSIVFDAAAIIIAVLTALATVLGLLTSANPAFSGDPIGTGLVFNDLLPGYLVPAIAAAVVARLIRRRPGDITANGLDIGAVLLSLTYVTLMTRHVFQGEDISMIGTYLAILPHTSDQEFWSYSAVWLVYGIALLIIGGLARSQQARLIAAAIIVLTVAKVFLFDMSELTGIFRALSFIGLGAVLIGIGFVYQKWLFKPRAD